mmetsp:Transcript_54710/g.123125  ORF Transcript_54710/g.123125 Transcript_54710/m.123125 type:complete len:273 (+) Transcript_54710:1768-2586(+)
MHFEEGMADVAHNLEADRLDIVGYLIQSHPVHLDGRRPLFLLEVDVAHVHSESPTERVLLVLHDLRVDLQGLNIVVVGLLLYGKVQADCVGEVDVQLVQQTLLLSETAELPLLLPSFLPFLQCFPEVALLTRDGTLLDEPMDLLFHLAKLLLGGQFCLLLEGLGGTSILALVQWVKDSLLLVCSCVASSSIGCHWPRGLRGACAKAAAAGRHSRHPASTDGRRALHVGAGRRSTLHVVEVVLRLVHPGEPIDTVTVVRRHELLLQELRSFSE